MSECNCHTGSARTCPIHTQVDFDAAEQARFIPPQLPGALIWATVENMGKRRRRLLFRRAYEPNPWVSQQDVCDRAYWADVDLSDVVVVYEGTDHE